MPDDLQKVSVSRFSSPTSDVALYQFQGDIRDLIVKSFNDSMLRTGRYAEDERKVSPQGVSSLVSAAGAAMSTALAASTSGTLYAATSNPATLMKIGNGVGAAVMGPKGIVAQAPFIPVSAALPVVLPIMAVQVLNTVLVMQQFSRVNKKLDSIKQKVDKAIARTEATHIGELFTASRIVDEVDEQYRQIGQYTPDMMLRLAIAERDVHVLAERYKHLVLQEQWSAVDDLEDVQSLNYDAHSAILSSFLDLRISNLRLGVSLQENPGLAVTALKTLQGTVEDNLELWNYLLERSERLRSHIEEAQAKLDDRVWIQKVIPGSGHAQSERLEVMKDGYVKVLESEKSIMKGFYNLIDSSKETLAKIKETTGIAEDDSPAKLLANNEANQTIVYWEDENGRHSFATNELTFE